MIRFLLIKPVLFILLVFIGLSVVAQQSLSPLNFNPRLIDYAQKHKEAEGLAHNKSGNKATLIPVDILNDRVIFRDDFSDYGGWPRRDLWEDNHVFVNNSFGSSPYTKGVATFDGLDSLGYPYNFIDPTAYGMNDHLTSNPIDMAAVDLTNPNIDTVYLSFFYQPQGLNPFATEAGDSLILEFYDPAADLWTEVWSVDGTALHPFKKVTLKVDESYYQSGFQFRFTNFGNRTGCVDHWHIDYVYMSSNTLADHLVLEDMAFRLPVVTLLKDYTAMPWWHYQISDMLPEITLPMWYFNTTKPKSQDIKFWLELLDSNNTQVYLTATDNPEYSVGFLNGATFNWSFNNSGAFAIPPNNIENVNFFTYKIYHSFNNFSIDSNQANDTIVRNQVFGSYYAYDDGTAEAGFGVFGSGGKLAYAFDIGNETDTLTGLNLYFNPVIHDRSREQFRLAVWREDPDNEGFPGEAIYINKRVDRPKYWELNAFKGVDNFVRYTYDGDVVVTGKFYVGWVKLSDDRMNIGYDVNRDFQDRIFIDIGGGWQPSDSSGGVIPGCLMIRPVFRSFLDPVIGVEDNNISASAYSIYPNPAQNKLFIKDAGSHAGEKVVLEVYNAGGSLVLRNLVLTDHAVDISALTPGLYIVRMAGEHTLQFDTQKLVISR